MLNPADRLDEENHILERLKVGARVEHFETVRVRKDGSRRDVRSRSPPVKSTEGHIIGARAMFGWWLQQGFEPACGLERF